MLVPPLQWIEGQIIQMNFVGEFTVGTMGTNSRSRRSNGSPSAVAAEESHDGAEGEQEEAATDEATHSPEGYRRVQEVLVHFTNWHARFDEWITEANKRIAPLHSHTSANASKRGRKERANRRSGRTERSSGGGSSLSYADSHGGAGGDGQATTGEGIKKTRYCHVE
jgi:hypothetical protein